jgi:hypothetical protein
MFFAAYNGSAGVQVVAVQAVFGDYAVTAGCVTSDVLQLLKHQVRVSVVMMVAVMLQTPR